MKKLLIFIVIAMSLINISGASQVEGQAAIYKGWNLVYGFIDPRQLAGGLESEHIKAVYAYLPQKQQYVRTYPNPESDKINGIVGDDYFEKIALWVYSDVTSDNSLNGMPHAVEYLVEEPLPLNERELSRGWNLVGVTFDMYKGTYNPGYGNEGEYFSWDAIKGSCNFEIIYAWGASNQNWFNVSPSMQFKSYDFDDFLFNGMAVKVSNNCRLGFSEERISPPPLPD